MPFLNALMHLNAKCQMPNVFTVLKTVFNESLRGEELRRLPGLRWWLRVARLPPWDGALHPVRAAVEPFRAHADAADVDAAPRDLLAAQ